MHKLKSIIFLVVIMIWYINIVSYFLGLNLKPLYKIKIRSQSFYFILQFWLNIIILFLSLMEEIGFHT